jgi:hypothetical protein
LFSGLRQRHRLVFVPLANCVCGWLRGAKKQNITTTALQFVIFRSTGTKKTNHATKRQAYRLRAGSAESNFGFIPNSDSSPTKR